MTLRREKEALRDGVTASGRIDQSWGSATKVVHFTRAVLLLPYDRECKHVSVKNTPPTTRYAARNMAARSEAA